MLVTLVLAAVAWTVPAAALGGARPDEARPTGHYVVRIGDTLWSIAERLVPGEDPRPLVDALQGANGVDAGSLVPGQTLVIPSR